MSKLGRIGIASPPMTIAAKRKRMRIRKKRGNFIALPI
jgi:hypothetical protein